MLVLDGVIRGFGSVPVLRGVSLEAPIGAVTGIIGPNGAGKSTLFSTITGFLPPESGTIQYDGHRIDGMRPDLVARRGLVRTFQVPREFGDLSVRENLAVAAARPDIDGLTAALLRPIWLRGERRRIDQEVDAMLGRLNLGHVADEPARRLSGGQKKLLELGRALMVQPRMLLLDEPFAGVAPALRDSLLGHFRALRAEGLGLVIIEHDIDAIMEISDTVCVMVEGRILVSGPPATVQRDPRVLDAYLGTMA